MAAIRLWHWLVTLPENRRWLWPLVVINLGGAVYGFQWYFGQLKATPWYLWPVTPDSPLAALYFGLGLLFLAIGRRQPWLEAFAFFAQVKYGLWTPIVLGTYMYQYGFDFEAAHLSLSHIAMAVEAIIFIRYFAPSWRVAVPLWFWFVFNDLADYFWWGTYPRVPDPALLPLAKTAAVALTGLVLVLFLALHRQARPAAERDMAG